MPAGRSNRVLFDLIPQRDAEPARSKPVVRIELKPQDTPAPRAASTSSPRPAGPAPRPETSSRPEPAPAPTSTHTPNAEPRSVQELPRAAGTPYAKPIATKAVRWPNFLGTNFLPIPLNLIYLSVAALVGVCVVVYLIGFSTGKSKAESNLAGNTRLEEPAVAEPRGTPSLSPPPTNTPAPSPSNNRPTSTNSRAANTTPPATPTAPAPAGAILTAKGPVMTDPRVAELNYLSLASLGEEDAKAAIAFLSANGVDAIGVPNRVESGSGRANNQGPTQVFRIYALPGITRDEYSQKLTARTNIEAAVAKIGATWQKEHRGASNFARTMWEKYRP